MDSNRIKIELPLPSVSLKRFLEKVLADDDFFALALENPVGAMRDCGVNLHAATFIPPDFATFFGALAGLKTVIKEKKLTDLSFENIFGQGAVVRGAILDAEVSRGYFREWDNRDAMLERGQCYSTEQRFEIVRERFGVGNENIATEVRTDAEIGRAFDVAGAVSQTFESSSTDNHTSTDWSNPNDMQRSTGSDRGVNKNFEGSGFRTPGDYLRGPLINPVDLASISARIQIATQVLKQTR